MTTPGVTHVLHVSTCPKCGKESQSVHGLPMPIHERGCTGTYEQPHGRKVMDVVVYDLVPVPQRREGVLYGVPAVDRGADTE